MDLLEKKRTVTVKIRGCEGDTGEATFDEKAWNEMAPVTRILEIHSQLRHITHGKPYEVVSRTTS